MEWKIGSAGTFTRTTNKDTIIVASKDSGIISGIFKVTDKFGNTAADTIIDSVITDPPVPAITIVPAYDSAGNSITLPLGTKISYKASVQQRFGSVAKITWSYQGTSSWGNGGIQDSGSITFDRLGEQRLICRVRDDDGNVAADTLNVLVVTVIGGVMPMNVVLRESASPYEVNQNLVVQAGAKLTIEPGTMVRIDPGIVITIYGTLDAEGTSMKNIALTAPDSTGSWNIQWLGGRGKMAHCNIKYGGLSSDRNMYPDTVILDSCLFQNTNIFLGPWVDNALSMAGIVKGCVFQQCQIQFVGYECWTIEGNKFISDQNMISDGMNDVVSNHFSGGGNLTCTGGGKIVGNFIEKCNGHGIDAYAWWGEWGEPLLISGNTVKNSMQSGIFLGKSNTPVHILHNDINGNGFGAPPSAEPYLNAGIVCMDSSSTIDSNTITNNSIGAICSSSDILTNNNIYNNKDFDFRVLVNDLGNVTAPNNWWGTADTATIQTKIFDYNDDNGLGKVLIDPVATDSIPGAGPR
jgi:hypothetical protein